MAKNDASPLPHFTPLNQPMKTPFKNVLFSATVNQGTEKITSSDANTCRNEDDSSNVSYNDLKRMIEEMGGKVCATVHKKVDYLVASKGAVESATQRVRKADKFKVPVVSISFIEDVYNKRVTPDAVDSYMFSSESISGSIQSYKGSHSSTDITSKQADTVLTEEVGGRPKKSKKRPIGDIKETNTASDEADNIYKVPSFVSSETFDCACICHDRGESSCSWCASVHICASVGGEADAPLSGSEPKAISDTKENTKKKKKRSRKENDQT